MQSIRDVATIYPNGKKRKGARNKRKVTRWKDWCHDRRRGVRMFKSWVYLISKSTVAGDEERDDGMDATLI